MDLPTIFFRCDMCMNIGYIPPGGVLCICPDHVKIVALWSIFGLICYYFLKRKKNN